MKTLIAAVTGLTFVFGGCSDDDEPGESNTETNKKRISRIDILQEDDNEHFGYKSQGLMSYSLSYSSDGRIKSYDYYYKYTFDNAGTTTSETEIKDVVISYVYSRDKITEKWSYPDGDSSTEYYLKNGVIVGDNIKRFAIDTQGNTYENLPVPGTEYVYDSSNRLVKRIRYSQTITRYQTPETWEPEKTTYNYIWSDGNVSSVKWECLVSEEEGWKNYTGTLENSYSSKSSFNLPNQMPEDNIILALQGFYGPNSKNLLESSNNHSDSSWTLLFPEIYEYEYDGEGYPIRVTLKYKSDLLTSMTTTYMYVWENY